MEDWHLFNCMMGKTITIATPRNLVESLETGITCTQHQEQVPASSLDVDYRLPQLNKFQ